VVHHWAFCWAGLRPTQLHSCFCHFIQSRNHNQKNIEVFFFDKRRILKLTSHFNVSPGIAVRPGEPRRGVPGRMEARGEVNEARPQGKQRVLRGHLDSPSLRSFATLSWCPLSAPAVGPCGVFSSSHFDMFLCLEPSVVAPCAVVLPDWVLFFATLFNFSPDE